MNNNKNVFPFPGYQYKNAERKSNHFSIAKIPIQCRQQKEKRKDPMGKVIEMIAGILSVKAQRKTNKDAR
jgi:hypothetical protein